MKRNPADRFSRKWVEDLFTGCWNWTAALEKGYGYFRDDGRIVKAHRWSYEHHIRALDGSEDLHHRCQNRRCVNPAHLQPVTPAEHGEAHRLANSRCSRGHEWTPENTRWHGRARHCRTCLRERMRRIRANVHTTR